jgi:hypothetical protein
MVELESRLRRKSEEVVAKVMDGEAIIINLATGVYYSLDHAGVAMWERMEAGWRLDEIAAAIAVRYEVSPEHARRDVQQLAAELLHEDIVAPLDAADAPGGADEATSTPKLPYTPPTLHAYRDMEDLLALDPPTPSLTDIPWKG